MVLPVSVLIPTYNVEPFVAETVALALVQAHPAVEVVIVNDGSTDGTRDVLAAYEGRGVRVIDQANAGQCAAANRAFRKSRGELVKFFDADDVLVSHHAACQLGQGGNGCASWPNEAAQYSVQLLLTGSSFDRSTTPSPSCPRGGLSEPRRDRPNPSIAACQSTQI